MLEVFDPIGKAGALKIREEACNDCVDRTKDCYLSANFSRTSLLGADKYLLHCGYRSLHLKLSMQLPLSAASPKQCLSLSKRMYNSACT